MLADTVSELESRVSPVSSPDNRPKETGCPEEPRAAASEVADRVESSTRRFIAQRLRIQTIIQNLEI